MFKIFKKFRSDERGAIAIIAALITIPLLIAAGLSIDYGRTIVIKNVAQKALDAAVLAGGAMDGAGEDARKEMAKAVFDANFPSAGKYGVNISAGDFTVAGDTVSGSVPVKVPTTLMRLANPNNPVTDVNFVVDATARFPVVSKLEVALVLDYSDSMGNGDPAAGGIKYKNMANAVRELIDDLTDDGDETDKVSFALAPFSTAMYGTFDMKYIRTDMRDMQGNTYANDDDDWTGCFGDRRGMYAQNAAPPDDDEASKFGLPPVNELRRENKDKNYCPDEFQLEFQRLSNNYDKLKESIDIFKPASESYTMTDRGPSGWTHLSLGTAMGWHLVSSAVPFGDDGVAGGNVKKVVVLLTDGDQTIPGEGPAGEYSTEQADLNTEELCKGMKAAGIRVITVGYDLDDTTRVGSAVLTRLEECASEPSDLYFFNVDGTQGNISDAFADIARVIYGMVRLIE